MSTGRFNIDDDGLLVDLDGEPILEVFSPDIELADVEAFFLSIEPPNDPDTEPSPTHLLAGTFSDGVAELGVSAPDALGIEASESKGAFVLATPSDGPGTHERSGVWFVYPDGRPGLDLPKLPKGWTYEGWAFIDEVPVTTGTFRDGASADGSNRYSAELEPLPPLPGEDFLVEPPAGVTFPPELRGQRIIVSIEPDPDTGAGPFYLRPLTYDVPQDATDRLAYEMHNDAATFPTGAATLIP